MALITWRSLVSVSNFSGWTWVFISNGYTDWINGSLKFKPALLEGPLTFPNVVTTATCPEGTTNRD